MSQNNKNNNRNSLASASSNSRLNNFYQNRQILSSSLSPSTSTASATAAATTSANDNNNYMNFNDFLIQHNFQSQLNGYQNNFNNSMLMPTNYNFYQNYQGQNGISIFSNDANFHNYGLNGDSSQYFYENNLNAESLPQSNLLATANEFIPRFNNLTLNDQSNSNASSSQLNSRTNSTTRSSKESKQHQQGPQRQSNDKSSNGYQNDESNYNRNVKKNKSQHQKFDNYRHNKRRDNWNRNRNERELSDGFNLSNKSNESPKSSGSSPQKHQKNSVDNEKLSQREKLIKEIEARRLECLVCVELIKSHHNVWSCQNCYHIFHLNCVTKWATSSKTKDGEWRCPACQNILKQLPRHYFCFCGKIRNPEYNRNDLAHSCGETCGRKDNCSHSCTLLCHPGPCPPCQAFVTRDCGCGKTKKSMQCFLKEEIECDFICDKLLNCELHQCTQKCHQGKCPACDHKVEQKCHCGRQQRQVPCTRDSIDKKNYSCGKPCNKDLTCGNHKCKDCCHSGNCKTCKLSPESIISCPCGKMPIKDRKSCLDPIPVCLGICGKILKCGPTSKPHHCTSKCHLGNCPPCNKQTAVKCRCGHINDIMIKCRQLSTRADDARCKKRCTKKRSCGKHKCNQECCIDIDHICPMPCNYTLSCGKHKCDQPCHRGNCMPCYRSSFEELYCECGAQVIYPPVPCGTKKPACDKPCSRQHSCNHEVTHNCDPAPCPPCMILTTKWCFGHHEQRKTIPCSQESFSCGLACNKKLSCGNHKCIKPCHDGICQVEGEVCKQNCPIIRSNCGHKCNAPCHQGDCPDTPCKEMVEVTCECANRKQMRTCHDFSREYKKIQMAALASSMAEMQRGNSIELSDIMGPIKMSSNKTLECTEECRVLERNRRLAIGLQIRNPDTQQKLLTRYSDFIRGWYKKDSHLVKNIHEALTDLVKLAKASQQKNRRHSFPSMNREKRQLIHEMCGMFGVESEAFDNEPNRNVVATAYRDRSWLPAMSIMEVMKRESGQRRPPTTNAWGLKK